MSRFLDAIYSKVKSVLTGTDKPAEVESEGAAEVAKKSPEKAKETAKEGVKKKTTEAIVKAKSGWELSELKKELEAKDAIGELFRFGNLKGETFTGAIPFDKDRERSMYRGEVMEALESKSGDLEAMKQVFGGDNPREVLAAIYVNTLMNELESKYNEVKSYISEFKKSNSAIIRYNLTFNRDLNLQFAWDPAEFDEFVKTKKAEEEEKKEEAKPENQKEKQEFAEFAKHPSIKYLGLLFGLNEVDPKTNMTGLQKLWTGQNWGWTENIAAFVLGFLGCKKFEGQYKSGLDMMSKDMQASIKSQSEKYRHGKLGWHEDDAVDGKDKTDSSAELDVGYNSGKIEDVKDVVAKKAGVKDKLKKGIKLESGIDLASLADGDKKKMRVSFKDGGEMLLFPGAKIKINGEEVEVKNEDGMKKYDSGVEEKIEIEGTIPAGTVFKGSGLKMEMVA